MDGALVECFRTVTDEEELSPAGYTNTTYLPLAAEQEQFESGTMQAAIITARMTHKIGDLILTTRRATIMTTNLQKVMSSNLFEANDSITFDEKRETQHTDEIPPLAAVTLIAERSSFSDSLEELAAACGSEAIALITAAFPNEFRLWLLVADARWRQKNRIVLHQKLWKNNAELIRKCAPLKIGDEVEFESTSGIRFAGVMQLSTESSSSAMNAVRTNPNMALVFSRRSAFDTRESVRALFTCAFPRNIDGEQSNVDWQTLAISLCPQGDLVLRVSGNFDDREAAVDIIGAKDAILKL